MNDFEATEIVRTVSIDRRLKNIVCGRRLLISRGASRADCGDT